jgi:hypothetical protein
MLWCRATNAYDPIRKTVENLGTPQSAYSWSRRICDSIIIMEWRAVCSGYIRLLVQLSRTDFYCSEQQAPNVFPARLALRAQRLTQYHVVHVAPLFSSLFSRPRCLPDCHPEITASRKEC